jgi:hypothetical protein
MLAAVPSILACASTDLPTEAERTAIGAGDKAIVLLKVECTVDQQSCEPFGSSLVDDNISFGLGTFETGGEPKRQEGQRFLSSESRRAGWTYFVLPHGTYYLAAYPPRRTDALTYQRSLAHAPRWRMDLPVGSRLIYAGTLRLNGHGDWLLFGGRAMRTIRGAEVRVEDDREAALDLLREHFPEWGEMKALPLERQEGPVILHSPLPESPK